MAHEAAFFKERFKSWLRENGHYKDMVIVREEAKRLGSSERAAWLFAAERDYGKGVWPGLEQFKRIYTTDEVRYPRPSVDMIDPAEFGNRDCDERTAIRWVGSNLSVKVGTKDAPSAAAWNLLSEARNDPKWFWEKVWPKLVASTGKVDPAQEKASNEEEIASHLSDEDLDRMIDEAIQ